MKPFAHVFRLALGLSLVGLLAGCVSSDPRTAQRIEPANDFEVVETSARRPLTGKEMAELRGTVARYLDQQGESGAGDYYLKVYLTPEIEGVTPEWVVVRFTRYSDVRVNVASAYDYPYSSSYYSYDTYPYGYDGFGRISFQYYDDPFYGRRYYYPRHDHRKWDRDHDHHRPGDRDHDHDHKPGDHRPPGGLVNTPPAPRTENPRRRTPDRIAPSNQPQPERVGRRPRPDDDHRGVPGRSETAGTPSRPVNPAQPSQRSSPDRPQWRGRNESSGTAYTPPPRPTNAPRAEARNETRTYSPPPRVQTEQRSSSSSNNSNNSNSSDRREVRDDGKRSGNQP